MSATVSHDLVQKTGIIPARKIHLSRPGGVSNSIRGYEEAEGPSEAQLIL